MLPVIRALSLLCLGITLSALFLPSTRCLGCRYQDLVMENGKMHLQMRDLEREVNLLESEVQALTGQLAEAHEQLSDVSDLRAHTADLLAEKGKQLDDCVGECPPSAVD